MKRSFLYCIAALFFAFAMTSCGKGIERKIRLDGVDNISFHSFSGVDVTARITNDSGFNLRLESADVSLFYDGCDMLRAQLISQVVVPSHTSATYETRWKLKVDDPTVLMRLDKMMAGENRDRIKVSFAMVVKGGPVRRRIFQEMISLSDFLNIFGVSLDTQKEQPVSR